ncbi:hypothetical protein AB6A40_005323 [Gnathostoma spinigerum]|uniref:Uncharacterized protein n=1 Tax=Gnathostoma spinigerum TaxID=75299 RepID=A0ABD6EF42_9BILA
MGVIYIFPAALVIRSVILPLSMYAIAREFDVSSNGSNEPLHEGISRYPGNEEKNLHQYILKHYDLAVRPVINASTVVNIFMGLTLTHIFNIDERNQVLTLNAWVEQYWKDERISWNPADYGNITKLTVGKQHVWTPDIVLYNNARDFARGFIDTNLHVLYTGDIQWAPPAKIYSICKLDVAFFPFDDQFCQLEFGSWIYDIEQMDLQIMERFDGKDAFTRDSFTENGEWEIVANRTRKIFRGRHAVFPTIIFELHLRRRMLYFLYNIIAPCVMLSILTMMQFMLPCESGEKVTLGLTVLLAYSVFSFNIAENMPETSEVIPLIAIYLMAIMGISGLSVCLSVAVLNMRHGADKKRGAPYWLDFLAHRVLGRMMRRGIQRKTEAHTEASKDLFTHALIERAEVERHYDELTQHWSQISIIFDRFFFCCIFLLTAVTTILLLLCAPRFSQRTFDSQ